MKARYLTFFSYIGSYFRSSEKIWLKKGLNYPDPKSIQGMLEIALHKFKSLNYPHVILSSRTDGGVHALNASAHFDLERNGSGIYEPDDITHVLNRFFHKNGTSIRVKQCYRVNDDFHARFKAIHRTYLYRLAVIRHAEPRVQDVTGRGPTIPIEEWKRCHFLRAPEFDIEKFKQGAQYLVGYHDFTTFRRHDKMKQTAHNRRELQSITVKPGWPLVTSYSGHDKAFDYWDIEIRGRAFVHKQIRRMIGALVSVALGKIPPEEIKVMLQVPSKHSWHSFMTSGPPDGLYLCDVAYNAEDLIYTDKAEKEIQQPEESDSDE